LKEFPSPYALVLAAFMSLIALVFLFSIIAFLTQNTQTAVWVRFLSRPGAFLYESFLWGCFYVPLYLSVSSYLLISRPFRRSWLYTLTLSIIPFLSFSLFLKIAAEKKYAFSPFTGFIIAAFGRIPGAALVLVATAIEILLLVQLYGFLKKRDRATFQEPRESLSELRDRLFGSSETESDEEGMSAREVDEEELRSPEDFQKDPFPLSEEVPSVLEDVEDAEFERVETDTALVAQNNGRAGNGEGEDYSYLSVKQRRYSGPYAIPVEGILQDYADSNYWKLDAETEAAGQVLMRTLQEFNIEAELTGIQKGPVITMFEILPSPGVKLSRIVNLADNIALRLAALRVRIVAPIPGKHAVGIEVPNKERVIVPFKEMITLEKFQRSKYEIPVVLGKDISGGAQIVDLVQTPHILIAGATGSGKSVCVNSLICSILYKKPPDEVKLLLIDPKIVELKVYNDIPHLLTPVVTDPKRCYQALQYCIDEMERRYSLLDSLEVRDVRSYNRKIKKNRLATLPLPYLVIVIDEFADLMATTGKEMETTLARLAAMSRAVGIYLVLATQRPSVDVITGLIKANIPSRIAFMVASKFDSRIIIDTVGADKLLGQGDMLFVSAWDPVPVRIQGAFLTEEEIEAITSHVRTLGEPEYIDEEIFFDEEEEDVFQDGEEDPLMDRAMDIITAAGKASASYLQRRLKIGYNRAARLIEHMEMRGIVGPANGSKPREIIHIPERK
jgi:S-DNA-T family DNA segregation ATPase FtsK/SpoIIIE